MPTKKINTKDITRDLRTQMREKEMDPAVVNEYAMAMENGDQFPPIVVFSADGKSAPYYLGDGWYRTAAAEKIQTGPGVMIEANVRKGGLREAILYAAGANHGHGVRRTNADKRKAVKALLADDEWFGWADTVIAKRANVSQPFVSTLRREQEKVVDDKPGSTQNVLSTQPAKRIGSDGVARTTRKVKPKAAAKTESKQPELDVVDKRRVTETSEVSGPAPGMITDGKKEKPIAELLDGKPLYIQFIFIPKVPGVTVSVNRGPGTDATRQTLAIHEMPQMPEPVLAQIAEQLNGKAGK